MKKLISLISSSKDTENGKPPFDDDVEKIGRRGRGLKGISKRRERHILERNGNDYPHVENPPRVQRLDDDDEEEEDYESPDEDLKSKKDRRRSRERSRSRSKSPKSSPRRSRSRSSSRSDDETSKQSRPESPRSRSSSRSEESDDDGRRNGNKSGRNRKRDPKLARFLEKARLDIYEDEFEIKRIKYGDLKYTKERELDFLRKKEIERFFRNVKEEFGKFRKGDNVFNLKVKYGDDIENIKNLDLDRLTTEDFFQILLKHFDFDRMEVERMMLKLSSKDIIQPWTSTELMRENLEDVLQDSSRNVRGVLFISEFDFFGFEDEIVELRRVIKEKDREIERLKKRKPGESADNDDSIEIWKKRARKYRQRFEDVEDELTKVLAENEKLKSKKAKAKKKPKIDEIIEEPGEIMEDPGEEEEPPTPLDTSTTREGLPVEEFKID